MVTLVERLRAKADSFYNVRRTVGTKQKIYILTRTWPTAVGVGTPTDVAVKILPPPEITDLRHRRMVTPHGDSIMGDIIVTGIAYNLYTEAQLGNITDNPLQERFYLIDGNTYSVGSVTQQYISWQVTLTKTNKDLWRDDIIPDD